ncbi:penicillin acylase family protein [bacterium]|nr:MAG: penicillin acylase family protein [bacterium]
MKTVGNIFLLILILVIGAVSLGYYWTFSRPIPNPEASYDIKGLEQPVSIYWDEHHVPHIEAKTESDLYYAIGFVHAQERLWQMTLVQLAGEGTFSEHFGEATFEIDRYQRMIGYWRMAEKIEAVLTDRERAVLKSYSKGVNDWVAEHQRSLPIEFALAQMEPITWTPKHSLALIRLLGWDLNVSWWSELAYARLATVLPENEFKSLIPAWSDKQPSSISYQEWKKTGQLLGSLLNKESDVRQITGSKGSHIGSNAWVVDGSKTKSGFPLLAGDPHLGFSIPGKWFELHASLNGREISGATHPGAPVLVLGQNDFMAWSLTNIMADDTDFYLEKVHPQDRGQYVSHYELGKPIYKPFTYHRTYITLKNGEQRVSELRFTDNGVIVSDYIDNATLPDSLLISMRWTGHEVSNEFGMMLKLNWADSFETVKQIVPEFAVPGQNLTYADKTGNIALFSMAKLPIRKHNPLTLGEGWNPEHKWQGWIPASEMPYLINPERGWIANANNKPIGPEYKHYLATFYEPDSRYKAIAEELNKADKFTVKDFKELQSNVYSNHAKDITSRILPVLEMYVVDEDIKTAYTYLSNWNFNYDKSATAASIFDTFFLNFFRNTVQDEIDSVLYAHLTWLENVPVRVMPVLMDSPNSLFDDKSTPDTIETKDDIIIKSMKEAIQSLRTQLGNETYDWRWENIHTLTLEPALFGMAAKSPEAPSALKLIVKNVLNRGPYGVDGHGMTINNAQYNWSNPYEMVLGPSIRRIIDFSDLRSTLSVIPGGQSGIPMSDYYDDQIELWLNGEYKELLQDMSLVKAKSFPVTTLIPSSNK